MPQTWVLTLRHKDPLEEETAIHSNILAWKIPWTEEPGRLQSVCSQRVIHDWVTLLSVSLQFSSVSQSCPTFCDPMNRSTPGLRVHHQLPEFTQTHVHWVSDAIQPSYPLSSPSHPAPDPSQHQGLFQWVNSLHQVAKYWSFSFSISPSNEHPGLISFRMDWLDLLAVQGTLKSLLQHHSAKASIFRRSAFFIVPLSHSYMTIGKTIALTRRTSVSFTSLFLQTSSLFSLSYSFALCIAFVTMKELQSANTQHSIFPCSTIQSICIYLLCLVDIKHGSGSWEKCAKLPIVIDSLIKLRMGVRVKSVAQFRWFA